MSVIVADTSVWIDFFNNKSNSQVERLHTELRNGEVIMGDLILHEILRGFRSDLDYRKVKKALVVLPMADMLGTQSAIAAAENYRKLRKLGLTVRKSADVIIATYCIEHGLPLLFTDRDFDPFVTHLSLMKA